MFGFGKKNNRRRETSRRPMIESLENRTVFAGNIVATFDPATRALDLTGDGLDNAVLIRPNAAGGISLLGQLGTTINGAANIPIPVPSLGAVTVNLQSGDDSISVNGVSMGSFKLQETFGDDRVRLTGVGVSGGVSINTHSGKDEIRVDGLFQGAITINSGIHDDQVFVSGRVGVVFAAAGSKDLDSNYVFGGALGGNKNLTINTGSGLDRVSLTNLDVDGKVFVDTGAHDDIFRTSIVRVADLMSVKMGSGIDNAFISQTACPQVNIEMGDGNDFLRVDPLSLGSGVWVLDGGLGVDTLDRNGSLLGIPISMEVLL